VIDGAGLLHLVGDELVALVEEQDAELLFLEPIVAANRSRRHEGIPAGPALAARAERAAHEPEFAGRSPIRDLAQSSSGVQRLGKVPNA
jgi:hypothetical protein